MRPHLPASRVRLIQRPSNPPIIPIPARATGNNVPHSLHKTRRTWKPNVKRVDLPVNVLGDALEETVRIQDGGAMTAPGRFQRFPSLKGVKMRARDMKSVGKAGGVEGLLLSRPASQLTPFGRALRHDLFRELHKLAVILREDKKADGVKEEIRHIGTEVPRIEGRK